MVGYHRFRWERHRYNYGGLRTGLRCTADARAFVIDRYNKDAHGLRVRRGIRGHAKADVIGRRRAVQLYPRPLKESMRKLEALIEYLIEIFQRDGVLCK